MNSEENRGRYFFLISNASNHSVSPTFSISNLYKKLEFYQYSLNFLILLRPPTSGGLFMSFILRLQWYVSIINNKEVLKSLGSLGFLGE